MQKQEYSVYIDCDKRLDSATIDSSENYQVVTEYRQMDNLIYISDKKETLEQFRNYNVAVIALLSSNHKNQEMFCFPFAIESLSAIDYEYLDFVYHRTHHKAMIITETNRLIIQELTELDVVELSNMLTDQSISEMFGEFYHNMSELKEYLKEYYDSNYTLRGYGIWKVIEKSSHKMIGLVGFSKENSEGDIELGYAIIEKYRQSGYATEACKAVIQYAKESLETNRITALVDKSNEVSKHLLERIGFVSKSETEYVYQL